MASTLTLGMEDVAQVVWRQQHLGGVPLAHPAQRVPCGGDVCGVGVELGVAQQAVELIEEGDEGGLPRLQLPVKLPYACA